MSQKRSSWFESYWYSLPLSGFGPPYDGWVYDRQHATLKEAEEHCLKNQKRQSYLCYQVRRVQVLTTIKGKDKK